MLSQNDSRSHYSVYKYIFFNQSLVPTSFSYTLIHRGLQPALCSLKTMDIIITQTRLKKVSKCVLKHKSFNAMLNVLFSGGFLYDTCDDMAGN